jgi:flagellum-specific ATP synthase
VRAINTFLTTCRGQRMGIFAGSGVGKSVLLSMLARYTGADVAVIGLVGERGREVQEFLQDDLGPQGLARSVVVVATSDEPALMRRNAPISPSRSRILPRPGPPGPVHDRFVTRFAMAQRDIGLAGGSRPPPRATRPPVFNELPAPPRARRARRRGGAITGLFTVLVEGDDHNEPVADAVRGILDGHIVMERAIAERGRYPGDQRAEVRFAHHAPLLRPGLSARGAQGPAGARHLRDMEELIRLGAYRPGSSAEVDEAIGLHPRLDAFLAQGKEESTSIGDGYAQLAHILGGA